MAQHIEYVPYGEVFVEERNSTWSTPYKFNGKEQDEETGLYYYGARYYDPRASVWVSVDPLAEKRPWMSPYVYCSGNPVNMINPDGRDEKQRKAALAKAQEYVDKNPGNSYQRGAKGSLGQNVDCSGLASAAAKAGGEPDPKRDPAKGGGVERIQQNTSKIDMQDAQPGNFITFNKGTHVGIITKIIKDEAGNVIGFKFQDSGGDPSKGKSGPRNSTAMIGNDYWGKRIQGVYKWNTKPDTNQGNNNVKQGGSNQLPMLLKPYGSSQSFEQTVNKFLNGVIR